MFRKTNLKSRLVISVFLLGAASATAVGDVICVDATADPGGNGQTWGTAYKYLQDALYKPPSGGDQIWVADGVYKPDQDEGGNVTLNERTETFQLINGVAIYGGFAGGESSLDEQDWQTNVTILSGDIGVADANDDNSYHVVTGSGVDATAILDGFTITGGYTNKLVGFPDTCGAGMYNDAGSPTVTNCTFTWNIADDRGAGMYNDCSNPTVTNCTFSANSADFDGGGMCNYLSTPTVTSCTFIGNSATMNGGGMSNDGGTSPSPTVTNCTFSGNKAYAGGGMYNYWHDNPTVTNCTFSGNKADGKGGGMYNSWSDPNIVNCTFSGNSASQYGGGIWNSGDRSPVLTNCILWSNSAPEGPEMCTTMERFRQLLRTVIFRAPLSGLVPAT